MIDGNIRRYSPTQINNRFLVKDDKLRKKNPCHIQDKVVFKESDMNSSEQRDSTSDKSHKGDEHMGIQY